MPKIKTPLIGSIISFILIFIINILKGNSFFSIFSRSLISGALIFGIIFGVLYYFKNVLEIEFENENNEKDKEISGNVDIVVGSEEDNGEVIEEVEISDDSEMNENNDQEEKSDDILNKKIDTTELNMARGDEEIKSDYEDESDITSKTEKKDVFEDDLIKENIPKKTDVDKNQNDEIDNVSAMESLEDSEINKPDSAVLEDIDRSGDEFANMSDIGNESINFDNKEDEIETISRDKNKSLKDSIGVDVSFEDVAKAIRTKLNEDK